MLFTTKVVLTAVALCFQKTAFGEFIFRGTCSSIFQPQEVAITVDTSDVVFNLYVIPPTNRPVASQSHCQNDCLGTRTPPCRSAIYDPYRQTCWLLRADKQAALEFDTRATGDSILSGILIAPQTLTDYPTDRASGVPNCSNYCPLPAVQSADTITPVCIQDCPSSTPVCAGELSNCMDVPRRATYLQGYTYWLYTTDVFASPSTPHNLMLLSFNKKYDYTNIRITLHLAWVLNPNGGRTGWIDENYIYGTIVGGWTCAGEAGWIHTVNREMREGMTGGEWGETIHGEFSCTQYDLAAGSYQLQMVHDFLKWGDAPCGRSCVGIYLGGITSPYFLYVEEYIPSARNGLLKIDDMARCQSATVFNSYSTQWPSMIHENFVGRTNFVVWKYKKRSDSSTLRIQWSGLVYVDVNQKCLHFYFTINDQLCNNPYSIETSHRDWMYNTGDSRPSSNSHTTQLDGICRGLPAGRYDIALWVDFACPFYDSVSSYNLYDIGHGRPGSFIVEEINENLPINAILMSDGTMTKLPYFNRQYFVFNSGGCMVPITDSAQCFSPYIKTFTYNKLQANSALHVKWYGTQSQCPQNNAPYEVAKFYITFNGNECNTKIETWWYDGAQGGGYCKTRPKYVEGICKSPAFPAGPVTLNLMLGQATAYGSWSAANMIYGVTVGGTSYFMVEELYDGNI